MGKAWDGSKIAFSVDFWREALRVLKPGAPLLAFGGSRTYHRMTVAIEDAGFEIRDCLMWLYGTGFPKSQNISIAIDLAAQKYWSDMGKALDDVDTSIMLNAWLENLNCALIAQQLSASPPAKAGRSTSKAVSARANAALRVSREKSPTRVTAASDSIDRRRTSVDEPSVQGDAESNSTASSDRARFAGQSPESRRVTYSPGSFVEWSALRSLSASTRDNLKAAEALKTWLGSPRSSRQADTDALYAALTADLSLIISSLSETTSPGDTTSPTDDASVTSAIITASTAVNLIAFTVDTLRRRIADAAAGAEREVVGPNPNSRPNMARVDAAVFSPRVDAPLSLPATDLARQWSGYGSALKPSYEPIVLARKPLDGTMAANVARWGVGGLNIDGGRMAVVDMPQDATGTAAIGRWPSNVILDEEAAAALDAQSGNSRFFYTSKVSKAERERGCGALPLRSAGEVTGREDDTAGLDSPRGGAGRAGGSRNHHPTLKPIGLTRYLARLIRPTGDSPQLLVPFSGAGSEMIGGMLEGWTVTGIERDPGYLAIARERCTLAERNPLAYDEDVCEGPKPDDRQPSLF